MTKTRELSTTRKQFLTTLICVMLSASLLFLANACSSSKVSTTANKTVETVDKAAEKVAQTAESIGKKMGKVVKTGGQTNEKMEEASGKMAEANKEMTASNKKVSGKIKGAMDAAIPLRDFFKNPEKTYFQISPNGEHVAFLAPYESRLNVFVQKIGETEAKRITSEKEQDLDAYIWGNDSRILYIKDSGGNENFKLYGINIDGTNEKALTPFDSVTLQLIDELENQPDEMIIGINKRNKQIFDPYRLNIETGELDMIMENPGGITGWMTDHDGQLRVATLTDGVNQTVLYRATEKDEFKPVLTTNFKESFYPYIFTFDNKNVYGISNVGRDKSALVEFDIANGKEIKVIYEHPDVDVRGLSYSKKRKVLTSAGYTTWKRQREFLDEQEEKLYTRLAKELGDYEISIADENKEENKFLVRTYSDRSRGAYYFYDQTTDKLSKLADVSPWIDEAVMAEMKPIEYKSRDGLTIHGYLTVPKGVAAKNLPVIVNPHGGPWARDNWGYRSEVQFLASRGYAVFKMNFRGSTGYGRKFWESSFKQWGRTMQDDITDGVNWLIEQGIADPKRIGIYGASYGGYATLMGIVKTPDLYAAAVDYVGVSNMFTFMGSVPPYWKPYLEMLYEQVGNPTSKEDSLMLASVSPALHVDKMTTPLLVAQGAQDPRVKKAESDQIVEALRKRGVDVQYILKENEGHGFRNEENRFEFYEAMEAFFAKHLKK